MSNDERRMATNWYLIPILIAIGLLRPVTVSAACESIAPNKPVPFSCEKEIVHLKGGIVTKQPISPGQVFYQRNWAIWGFGWGPSGKPADLWYRYDGIADGRILITRHFSDFSEETPVETQLSLPLHSTLEAHLETQALYLGEYSTNCYPDLIDQRSYNADGAACVKPPDQLLIRVESDLKITVRQITEKEK